MVQRGVQLLDGTVQDPAVFDRIQIVEAGVVSGDCLRGGGVQQAVCRLDQDGRHMLGPAVEGYREPALRTMNCWSRPWRNRTSA